MDLLIQIAQRTANLLERSLFIKNAGGMVLKIGANLVGFFTDAFQVEFDGVKFMPRQTGFHVAQFIHDLLESPRLASLPLQRTDLALHLPNGVFQAKKILCSVIKLAEGFLFLLFELGDTSSFLKNHAALLWATLDDLRDLALGHDTVAVATNPGAHEKLLHIAQTAAGSIEKILTSPIAKYAASDGDFIIVQVHPGSLEVFVVHIANGDRHFRHARGLATAYAICAAEDYISHLSAAQRLGRLLAKHPSDGVRYIGFAATIWTHNGRDSGLKIQSRSISERLEADRF